MKKPPLNRTGMNHSCLITMGRPKQSLMHLSKNCRLASVIRLSAPIARVQARRDASVSCNHVFPRLTTGNVGMGLANLFDYKSFRSSANRLGSNRSGDARPKYHAFSQRRRERPALFPAVSVALLAFFSALLCSESCFHSSCPLLSDGPVCHLGASFRVWSDAPRTSLNSNIALQSMIITGICLSTRFSSGDLARILIYSGFMMAIICTIWAIVAPKYGVHQLADVAQSSHAGSWRGVFLHKNVQGQMAAIFGAP